MSVVVARNKEVAADASHPFHRMQLSIPWPEGAISAARGMTLDGRSSWSFYTVADKLKQKREKMENQLFMKREFSIVRRVPLYVWVFWVPGDIYSGWWTYIVGCGISQDVNFRGIARHMSRVMELFPLVAPPLFGDPDFEKWQREFVKKYPRGCRGGKPQGKAPVWAEVNGKRIERLLSRAEWPEGLTMNTLGTGEMKNTKEVINRKAVTYEREQQNTLH